MDYLAIVTFSDNKMGMVLGPKHHLKVTVTAAIILKRMWEAHYDAMFNQIPMDMMRLATFSEKYLFMEMSCHHPLSEEGPTTATIH